MEGEDFEDTIRTAISIGGDSDTIACMAGSIAEAYFGEIPEALIDNALVYLPEEFKQVITAFQSKFIQEY